ncbi:hypothetical protein SCATT_p10180 (plasmid) [Streptantibioticus cattleyicolor NRRL 8057 = DSM 46488]|uniref:Uncharacterized protein n=1 Tax=Streptantibioticus cattleyicolor (strain ATCC 35852 / DSM 46488 / JCM 4925 / NBRC 14057 / NRRL 8057) TaxID=1003195 RepID=G8XDX6_STREN|nr:hypothetical protein SCATT_p10180 [Streptantibioticus cattleyicolor NRRL 8057 = DSM 46488]
MESASFAGVSSKPLSRRSVVPGMGYRLEDVGVGRHRRYGPAQGVGNDVYHAETDIVVARPLGGA